MRTKKSREVNIFSASVVDLFASGLGVFLIVSILALVNQKKEHQKNILEKSDNSIILSQTEDTKLLEKQNFKLQQKIIELKKQQKTPEIKYREKIIIDNQDALKLTQLEKKLEDLELKNLKLKEELKSKDIQIINIQKQIKRSDVDKFNSNMKIGQKVILENVQFYAGTDRPIEPYASKEILGLSLFLKENPMVYIEVSGHIFETKKAIEANKAEDVYNLSGKRANKVCQLLADFGVSDKRLRCIGYGAQRYIHLTNDQYSAEAQMNRRVEIEVLSK